MRFTTLLFIVLFLTKPSYAQKCKYEIGIEGGKTNDLYRIEDPLANIESVPCISGGVGLSLRRNLDQHFFVETGIWWRESWFGFKFQQEEFYGVTNAESILTVPLRIGYGIRLLKNLSIAPVAGMAIAFKSSDGWSGASGTIHNANSTIQYQYRDRHVNDQLFLLQGSINLEYIILNRVRLSLAPTYYHGFTLGKVYDVAYQIQNSAGTSSTNAAIKYYGSINNLQFGIKYLLTAGK